MALARPCAVASMHGISGVSHGVEPAHIAGSSRPFATLSSKQTPSTACSSTSLRAEMHWGSNRPTVRTEVSCNLNNSGREHGHRKRDRKESAARQRLRVSFKSVDAPPSASFSSDANESRVTKRRNEDGSDATELGLVVGEMEGAVLGGSYGSNGYGDLRSNAPRGAIAGARSMTLSDADERKGSLSKLAQRPTLPHRERAKRKSNREDRPKENISPEVKALNKLIAHAETAEEILTLYEKNGSEYNGINLCTTFHRLSKKMQGASREERERCRADPRTRRLALQLEEHVEHFDTQALSNIAWAHGKLRHGSRQLIARVGVAAVPLVEEFHAQEVASLLWAVAREWTRALRRAPPGLQPPPWQTELLETFAAEVAIRLDQGQYLPRNFHATIWAYATCDHCDRGFLTAMAYAVVDHAEELPSHTLANVAWAYAKLAFPAPHMYAAVLDAVQRRGLVHLAPLDISHLLWAMARFDMRDRPQLLTALSRVSVRKLAHFTPQALSNTAWAHARLEHHHAELFEALVPHVLASLPQFSPQALANLSWAFAACRHDSPELFDAIAKEATSRIGEFSEVGLAGLATAYANIGRPAPELFSALEDVAEAQLETMIPRTLANTAWALVVAGRIRPELFAKMRARMVVSGPYSPALLSQLFQVDLALQYEAPEVKTDLSSSGDVDRYLEVLWLSGSLRGSAAKCWNQAKHLNERHVSAFQADVSNTLMAMGIEHRCEYDEEEFSIDIALLGPRVAIEVDGPLHYTVNTLQPVGATKFKRRLLQRLGWKVLPVPFFEYNTYAPLHTKVAFMEAKLRPLLTSLRDSMALRAPGGAPGGMPGGALEEEGEEEE
eukprot:CAMPEP_0118954478 /NCGR_PEP_ID=MMETSP1169-20130426/58272_1 /TAXON_ID=36882 /ORGANISM="Pyramimonas obovata, Strain CCMP722" /LENGTH=840 /DNA_ID=CAMNT_0006902109 /DNA_START=59 /DNA_END=2578 /DNA_ORIENTATION=+